MSTQANKAHPRSPGSESSVNINIQLWTADDVAKFLQCSESYVYKAAEAGILPCLRVGRMLRFDPYKVRSYAKGQTLKSGR